MNVLERDVLRKIIELATGLLKADENKVSYAVDTHDDVPPSTQDSDARRAAYDREKAALEMMLACYEKR